MKKRDIDNMQMRRMGIDPDLVPKNISARSHWNKIDQWDPTAVARWAAKWNIDPMTSFIKGNAVNQPDANFCGTQKIPVAQTRRRK